MAKEGKASEAVALLGLGETQGEAKRPNGGYPEPPPHKGLQTLVFRKWLKALPHKAWGKGLFSTALIRYNNDKCLGMM